MLVVVPTPTDPLDLASTLRALGAPAAPTPTVDAAFFHRTLARWLGLPEGKIDGVLSPVQWDYRYWRADLAREPARDVDGRDGFAAALSAREDAPAEEVRWWVLKDARGRIIDAGWDSDPPRLIDDVDLPRPTIPPSPIDEATLARLYLDDDEDLSPGR
jgi:hypothetical protein